MFGVHMVQRLRLMRRPHTHRESDLTKDHLVHTREACAGRFGHDRGVKACVGGDNAREVLTAHCAADPGLSDVNGIGDAAPLGQKLYS